MAKRQGFLFLTAVAALAALISPAAADPVADFYHGKTVTMAVGTSPGGDYDLRMRMVARYIGKHIPGNPTVIATNMPGAGQMLVANWLANVAPKDGTVMVALSQNMAVNQATGANGVKYDVRQFNWIGNTTDTPNVINAWHTTGIKTIQDVMQRELVVGATGTASGSYLYPYALNQLVGTKFKIVTGYPGGNDVNLAMERGEVGGRGSNSWASWKSTRPLWLSEKKIVILVQVGVKRNPELPDIPTMQDLANNDMDRQVLTFISVDSAISRPLVTNAGVPRERVEALRRAFDATMKDPEFLAEAEKS
jgi:tripartite-type tricarboxylate transporter receptor subunit TctC